MSHKKFGPNRFSRFDVFWKQADRQAMQIIHKSYIKTRMNISRWWCWSCLQWCCLSSVSIKPFSVVGRGGGREKGGLIPVSIKTLFFNFELCTLQEEGSEDNIFIMLSLLNKMLYNYICMTFFLYKTVP